MKKLFLLNLLFLFSIISAQIKFEKGYFISNDGEKHEVLIKNEDWLNNPTEFIYKSTENSPEEIGKIADIKEFQVYEYNKLVRYKGKIDFSSTDIQNLSTTREPEWKEVEVFLYELSSGKISLYSFYGKGNQKYLYAENNGEIKPLIYKEYIPDTSVSVMAINDTYKTQLSKLFYDNPQALKKVNNLDYTTLSLTKVFNIYNGITNENSKIIESRNKTKVNLYIKPGINFITSRFFGPSYPNRYNAEFKSTELRFTTEMEYVLPFNKNKWSLLVSPTYNTMKANDVSNDGVYSMKINFSLIDFPIGIRHYMFLNQNSKFYVDAKFPIFCILTKHGSASYFSTYQDFSMDLSKSSSNFEYGIGFNYKNKYTIDFTTSMKRSFASKIIFQNYYQYNSLTIGYNIF